MRRPKVAVSNSTSDSLILDKQPATIQQILQQIVA